MFQPDVIQGTGGAALVRSLEDQGVERIFGLPGIQLDPVFDALYDSHKIELVSARHEQAVTYMADGYSRTSGKIGVGLVVPGPGFLNSTAGLATAYACGSKVLLLVGQIHSEHVGSGRGALHELPDQFGIVQRLSRWSRSVTSPDEVEGSVQAAFQHLEENPGPAVLELPADVLALDFKWGPGDPGSSPVSVRTGTFAEGVKVKARDALRRIAQSKNPLFVFGGGFRYARDRDLAVKFIEHFQASTVVTDNGKGSAPASNPLVFERSGFKSLLEDADVVVGIGTRFVDADAHRLLDDPEHVILVNTDEGLSQRIELVGTQVVLDLEEFMRIGLTGYDPVEPNRSLKERLSNARNSVRKKESEVESALEYLEVIREFLPSSGSIVADYTQLGYLASFAYPVESMREFIWPGYQGTLGYSFATGIGATFASEGPVLVIVGDGGFSWTMEELSTVARYRPNLITLIVNDGHYGNVRRIQKNKYHGREIASDLTNPNFVKMVESFGLPAVSVSSSFELRKALSWAAEDPSPFFIELKVGELPSPWGLGF